jgi:hypothetical protein
MATPKPPSSRIVPNEWEMLQGFLQTHENRVIEADFRDDIDIDSEQARGDYPNWTSEQQLKYICRHKDIDTASMALIRMMIFNNIRNKPIKPEDFFLVPIETWRSEIATLPQVTLVFYEKPSQQKAADRNYPLRLKVSFRIIQPVSAILPSYLTLLENKIKQVFCTPWQKYEKGRIKYSYFDKGKGYHFTNLTMLNETEAKKLITDLTSLQGDTPDWDLLNEAKPTDKDFAAPPKTETVLGKPVKYPKRRPLGEVYFRDCQVSLHPKKPFRLCSATNKGQFLHGAWEL